MAACSVVLAHRFPTSWTKISFFQSLVFQIFTTCFIWLFELLKPFSAQTTTICLLSTEFQNCQCVINKLLDVFCLLISFLSEIHLTTQIQLPKCSLDDYEIKDLETEYYNNFCHWNMPFFQLENLVYYNRLKHSKIVISDFHLAKLENGLIKDPCGTPEYLGENNNLQSGK